MNRAAIIISLVATLLVGASLGLMGGVAFEHRIHWGGHGPWPGGPPRPARPEGGRRPVSEVLARLQHELDLSPEQLKRIEPIVTESRRTFEAARETLRSRIDAELTPEQRERWRQMQRARALGAAPPGDSGRAHRAPPGNEGEPR